MKLTDNLSGIISPFYTPHHFYISKGNSFPTTLYNSHRQFSVKHLTNCQVLFNIFFNEARPLRAIPSTFNTLEFSYTHIRGCQFVGTSSPHRHRCLPEIPFLVHYADIALIKGLFSPAQIAVVCLLPKIASATASLLCISSLAVVIPLHSQRMPSLLPHCPFAKSSSVGGYNSASLHSGFL